MKVYWVHSESPSRWKIIAHAIPATVPLVDIERSSTICWSTVIRPKESNYRKCKSCLSRLKKGAQDGPRQSDV